MNTPKQLILNFYDCINDNFNVKIVIVLLSGFFFWLDMNCGYTHYLYLRKKKEEKGVFPRLKASFTI